MVNNVNTKMISLVLVLFCNNFLMSMEKLLAKKGISDQQSSLSVCYDVPFEIRQTIKNFINPQQWWYLKNSFQRDCHFESVCFDNTGKQLITGWQDGEVWIFDIETKKEIALFPCNGAVRSICLDGTGKQLATGLDNGAVWIFDIEAKKEIALLQCGSAVRSVCFDGIGKQLATGLDNGKMLIFDIEAKKEIALLQGKGRVESVCFNGINKRLATVSDEDEVNEGEVNEDEVKIFDIESQKEIALLQCDNMITSVCFDGTGKQLAIGLHNGEVLIFDIEAQKKIVSFESPNWDGGVCLEKVKLVCLDRTGKRLARVFPTRRWRNCKVQVFERYDDYSLGQLMLKNMLLTWLLIEKPDKAIDTVEKLLGDVASKFRFSYSYDQLLAIWNSFPQDMQEALHRTMQDKIQFYGKDKSFFQPVRNFFSNSELVSLKYGNY